MVYFPTESKPRLADWQSIEDVALQSRGLEGESKQAMCAFKRFYLNLIIFAVAKKERCREKSGIFILIICCVPVKKVLGLVWGFFPFLLRKFELFHF